MQTDARPLPPGSVAVLIPCYNEELTIGKVVDDFYEVLPGAEIWVYDNNSTDATARIAREHGARVRREPRQGKGNAVRQMLRDIDADCYLMVDGDDTYPAEFAPDLVRPVLAGRADHVVGDRLSNGTYGEENKRQFHGFGNGLVRWLIKVLYGFDYADVMTGYRAMSRPFARTYPVLSPGFELETELSIHAVDKRWRIEQVPIVYRDRPEGSESKLSTFSDGLKVLRMIASLFKDYRPMPFFCLLALICLILCLAFGLPVVAEFRQTGLVDRFPTAILAMGLGILAALLFAVGLVLDTEVKASRRAWEIECVQIFSEDRALRARNRRAGIRADVDPRARA
ncbi:MAG: glycosyltransferase [Coriobacteriales bacterium]|nr:glycosyltransferase [Coriobacteriales bacterium]